MSPGHVYPGRPYNWDMTPLYRTKEEEWGPSRHFTNVFNTFVWMTIFNMINARKINDEKNCLSGIFNNYLFIVVFFIICGGQVIITLFGGYALKVSLEPLPGVCWGVSIAFGVG